VTEIEKFNIENLSMYRLYLYCTLKNTYFICQRILFTIKKSNWSHFIEGFKSHRILFIGIYHIILIVSFLFPEFFQLKIAVDLIDELGHLLLLYHSF